jgi:ketosteroid isomerase-like protein
MTTTTHTTTTTTTPLGTVQALYECFGRGDLDGLLAHIGPAVDWGTEVHAPGADLVPMLGNGVGHDAVRHYFGGVAELDFHTFVPVRFLVDGDHVYVELDLDVEHRGTGKRARFGEIHHFEVRDGLVVRYRNFLDSAALIDLHRH